MKILGEALLTVAGQGREARRCSRLHSFRPLIRRRTHFVSARFPPPFFFFFSPPIVESVIPLTGNCLARQMFRPNARRWDYRGSFCCAAYIYICILDWCLVFISFFYILLSPSLFVFFASFGFRTVCSRREGIFQSFRLIFQMHFSSQIDDFFFRIQRGGGLIYCVFLY